MKTGYYVEVREIRTAHTRSTFSPTKVEVTRDPKELEQIIDALGDAMRCAVNARLSAAAQSKED